MRKYAKYWRDSASVIIAARNPDGVLDQDGFNYKVLVFKRTENTSFLPNHIVFPGGSFDPQDDSLEWLKFFADQKIASKALQSVASVSGPRPYILQTTDDDLLDRNISVRLCALRECFEELGVLLVAPKTPGSKFSLAKGGFDAGTWQKNVHDGRVQFRELYHELNETPDLWGLYEWSTWITPTQFRRKRFETAFFFAALNVVPEVFPENHEVEEYMWQSPRQLLTAHAEGVLWLAPPQAYELHRLSHVPDIDVLVHFANDRNRKGMTALCPIGYNTSDGYIGVLPGDDLYPAAFDFITENADTDKYTDVTAQELAGRAHNLHRVQYRGLHSQTYHHSGPPLDGHLHVLGKNGGHSKL